MKEKTILFQYNIDNYGNPTSTKIKEVAQVSPLKYTIQLEQIPDEQFGVTLLNEDNTSMVQVFNYDDVEKTKNSYYVNYTNGLIYFNSNQGTEKKIINYYGTGVELISCKRVFDGYYDANGKWVVEILQDIIDAGRKAIEAMSSIGDVMTILQMLQDKIAEGDTKLQELQNVIDEANDLTKVTGNEVVIINAGDWVYNPTNKMYEHTINHTMNSKDLIIDCYNLATGDFVLCGGKIVNNNSVLIKSETNIDLKVVLNARYYKATLTISDDIAREVVDARGGESCLRDRIRYYLIPEDFGAVGDGITDDTSAINNCLSYYGDSPCTINFSKKYLISDKLNVRSNTVLNLNASKIFFNNTSNIINDTSIISNSHWFGILNCEGEETTVKTKILGITDSSSNGITTLRTKIAVTDSNPFSIGDYIKIDVDRVGNQTMNTYRPSCNIMVRIVGLGSGYVITDYHTPFDFNDIDFTNSSYYITKINPCCNVTINGFNVENISPYTTNKELLASGIGVIYGSNIVINSVNGYNISNPLVITYYAHNVLINGVSNIKPSHTGDGQGYGIKLCRTYICKVDNLYGDSCRHLIDLSGSARVEIDFARGINTLNGDYDLHGMCEHDVVFRNCFGQFFYGNGFNYFPSIMQDVILENCKGKSSFNNIINLKVNQCELQYDNQGEDNTVLNAEVYNSTIHFIRQGDSRLMGATRGGKVIPKILFKNVIFKSPNSGMGCYPKFMNFYNCELIDCKVSFENVKGKIKIIDCDNFSIKRSEIVGCIFEPSRTLAGSTDLIVNDLYWRVNNTDSIATDVNLRDVFGFNTFASGLGVLNLLIKSSDFLIKTTNNSSPFIYFETPMSINCDRINVTLRNNKFDSSVQYCGKLQLRDNPKFILNTFGTEFTSNIANLKQAWNNTGNSMSLYDGSIISVGKEMRILSSNGFGIGISSDGTNIVFKKYVDGVYDSDIEIY